MEKLFSVIPANEKLFRYVKGIVGKKLNKKVFKVDKICNSSSKVVKTYKISLKNGLCLRLDIKFNPELTRLQKVAFENNIEIPKVIFEEGIYKFSEWIDGVMLARVWDIAEVFKKSGDLIGRLSLIKDPISNKFLTNSEFSSTNVIWSKDKKIYIVDHDRLKTVSNPDKSIVQILLKRIRNKERINLFLEAYSKHRSIDNIMKEIEKRNWNWDAKKTLMTNIPRLKY